MRASKGPSSLRRIAGLSLGSLLGSGSTYLLFYLASRRLDVEALGLFALVTTIATLTSQFVDGGQSVDAIVQARTPGYASDVWPALWGERVVRVLLAWAGALLLTAWVVGSIPLALLAGGTSASMGLYSFALAWAQAERSSRVIIALQTANGLIFAALATVFYLKTWLSVATALEVQLLGTLIPVLAVGRGQIRSAHLRIACLVKGYANWHSRRRPRRTARAVLMSTVVASNSDVLILGLFSQALVGQYAASQRIAMGLGALGNAATNYVFSKTGFVAVRRSRRLFLALTMAPLVLVTLAVLTGGPLLRMIYKSPTLVEPWTFGLIVGAFAAGLVAAISGPLLLIEGRTHVLANALYIQIGTQVPFLVAAGIVQSSKVAAGGMFLSRYVGMWHQGWAIWQESGSTRETPKRGSHE